MVLYYQSKDNIPKEPSWRDGSNFCSKQRFPAVFQPCHMGPMKDDDNYHDSSHAYSKVLVGRDIMEPDKIRLRRCCHDTQAERLI